MWPSWRLFRLHGVLVLLVCLDRVTHPLPPPRYCCCCCHPLSSSSSRHHPFRHPLLHPHHHHPQHYYFPPFDWNSNPSILPPQKSVSSPYQIEVHPHPPIDTFFSSPLWYHLYGSHVFHPNLVPVIPYSLLRY